MQDPSTGCLTWPAESTRDVLTSILRDGARRWLAQAVEAEVQSWIDERTHLQDEHGHQQVVRNGFKPPRSVLTGIGPVEVRAPRVRDRRPAGQAEKFSSKILPPYLRKARSVEDLVPWLYLRGISTGEFGQALTAILGPDAPGLSASTVTRLASVWVAEYDAWTRRSLAGKRYAYLWADGIHFNIRLEEDRQCILVLMGATPEGQKELIAVLDGHRESELSWLELLRDCKARGLTVDPKLATADGALGFWKAVRQVWPTIREQRCWVHKTANILDKMAKGVQPHAKRMLHAIWMADTKAAANQAFDRFGEMYGAKYAAAVECLKKDRDTLLTFYDFPAEHWVQVRTTNAIESTFATVRARTNKTKGSGSRVACLAMVFKLTEHASRGWQKLNSPALVAQVLAEIQFVDGKKIAA